MEQWKKEAAKKAAEKAARDQVKKQEVQKQVDDEKERLEKLYLDMWEKKEQENKKSAQGVIEQKAQERARLEQQSRQANE